MGTGPPSPGPNLGLLAEVLYDLEVALGSGMLKRSDTIFVRRGGTNLGLLTEVLYDLEVAPDCRKF